MRTSIARLLVVSAAIAAAATFPREASAIRAGEVEFGTGGIYDGAVKISRDTAGRMVFRDAEATTPTTLNELAEGTRAHGELTGLSTDDHPQYQTAARHSQAHTSAFNAALPIPADVDANATLGGHVADAKIHPNRAGNENISGAWRFFGGLESASGQTKFSLAGAAGPVDLVFEDGASDAEISWDSTAQAFELNRALSGPSATWETAAAGQLRCTGSLSGRNAAGSRSGAIEGFTSIEGIAPANYLSRNREEEILADWTFSGDVSVSGTITGSGAGLSGLEKPKGRIITVAKSGGDFDSVSAAVAAALGQLRTQDNPITVLVYPGTYIEPDGVQITGGYLSLAGIDRATCVIERNNFHVAAATGTEGVVNVRNGAVQVGISRLTIRNSGEGNQLGMSEAVLFWSGSGRVSDCRLEGIGGKDIFCLRNTSRVEATGVEIEQTKAGSSAGQSIQVADQAALQFELGAVVVKGTGPGPRIATTGAVTFRGCLFDLANASASPIENPIAAGHYDFTGNRIASGLPPSQFTFSGGGTRMVDMNSPASLHTVETIVSRVPADGAVLDAYYAELPAPVLRIHNGLVAGAARIDWGGGGGAADASLWRVAAGALKTDASFEAASLKTGGAERISSSGAGTLSALTVDSALLDNNFLLLPNNGGAGLGASAGRIVFADDTTDRVEAKDADLAGGLRVLAATGFQSTGTGVTGSVAGNARGTGATDLQTNRSVSNQVAAANYDVICGGTNNRTGGGKSSILGGDYNVVTGYGGSVLGGYGNTVSQNYGLAGIYASTSAGAYAIALGRRAKANHTGAIVLADSTDADFSSAAADEFRVRALGGAVVRGPSLVVDDSDNAWEYTTALGGAGAHDWSTSATCLTASASGVRAWFPVRGLPGTVVTQLRAKWRGGTSIGITLRLLKRNEAATDTAWTQVGATQTWTGAGVTVSTWDLTDETLAAGYSYSIEITSWNSTGQTPSVLYSIGMETSKRSL